MKRTLREKLGDFVLGKGFYIVLFLCVATIGISGYYLIRTASQNNQPLEPVTGNPTVVLPDKGTSSDTPSKAEPPVETAQPPAQIQTAAPQPVEKAAPDPPAPAAPAPVQTKAEPEAVYTWPVRGEILSGYSLEVLAYDETMGDWRTHSGVDIAAPVGTRVLAVSDGTILAVYQDDLMGSTVVVDHGGGMKSTYCNLTDAPTVAVGDEVETGTVIGAVGSTAIAESEREAHLHLEMSRDGNPVDPLNFLPQ